MKLSLLLITLFGQFFVSAQSPTKAPIDWDSLRLRTKEEIKRYEEIARVKSEYIDTLSKEGLITIIYTDINKNKLKVISYISNSKNCLTSID